MNWVENIKHCWLERNDYLVNQKRADTFEKPEKEAYERKIARLKERKARIVKASSHAKKLGVQSFEDVMLIRYGIHHQWLVKQNEHHFYIEERVEERIATFEGEKLVRDRVAADEKTIKQEAEDFRDDILKAVRFTYNRQQAVQYAERWWNDYNPAYRKFTDDCTNFVSQCLRAGGAPMRGYPNRSKGWWYHNHNWSYSWTVANALCQYLATSKAGLQAKEVNRPEHLELGDVICYDFDGDGKWQHTTIVVAKDQNNMPLVNAHTTNSRMRYWTYEDSTAYTNNIKYKFFHIREQ